MADDALLVAPSAEVTAANGGHARDFIQPTSSIVSASASAVSITQGTAGVVESLGTVFSNGAHLAQPKASISAFNGGHARTFVQPASSVTSSATVPAIASASFVQPRAVLQSSGETGAVGQASLQGPKHSLSAYAAATATLLQPALKLDVTSTNIPVGTVDGLTQPCSALTASGQIWARATALLKQPASQLPGITPLVLAQPYMSMVAAGEFPVETVYRAYAVNLSNAAVTEFTDYPVHTVVQFQGEHYAVGPDGIYKLTQDYETTDPTVVVETGLSDFDSALLKRLQYMYISTNTKQKLTMGAITGDDQPVRGVEAAMSQRDGMHVRRVQFGKGVKSASWGARVEYSGTDRLRVHRLEYLVTPTSRKVG